VKEKGIRDLAVSYLNKEENRKLPSHEFNGLVSRIKEYLRRVDDDKALIDTRFNELKVQVVNEARNKIISSESLKPSELNFKEIKSLA
jgi:hypothetical protein